MGGNKTINQQQNHRRSPDSSQIFDLDSIDVKT